jgi:hypothetical protein
MQAYGVEGICQSVGLKRLQARLLLSDERHTSFFDAGATTTIDAVVFQQGGCALERQWPLRTRMHGEIDSRHEACEGP